MKLKNKLRKRLFPILSERKLNLGDEIFFQKIKIGKVLINDPLPFAIIKLFDPNFSEFKDKEINTSENKFRIIEKF